MMLSKPSLALMPSRIDFITITSCACCNIRVINNLKFSFFKSGDGPDSENMIALHEIQLLI